MVNRNLTFPFQFYCITDDPKNINSNINIIHITDNFLESWWNKLRIFTPNLFVEKCLYLDLDTVIQNNIDDLITYSNQLCGVYTYWNDFYSDETYSYPMLRYKTPFNSSVMTWNAEDYYWIWDKFMQDPDWYIVKYYGDDKFLGNEIKNKTTFSYGWIYSRLYGIDEKIPYNDLLPINKFFTQKVHFYPECKICMFNGPTTDIHYKKYEQYFI